MPRPPVDIRPLADRIMLIVQPHETTTFYELELSRAEWLLADLRRAVDTAREWAGK